MHFSLWDVLAVTVISTPSPRGSGERVGRGVFLKWPPLPAPLLHKFVEEREKSKQYKN